MGFPRLLFTALLLLGVSLLAAQRVLVQYQSVPDSLRVGPETFLPFSERGHTLVLPDNGRTVRGVLVSLADRPVTPGLDTATSLDALAVAADLAVLYVTTGRPVDLYLHSESLAYVDATLDSLFHAHGMTELPVVLFGSMTAGHRALKYVEYVGGGHSAWSPRIRGAVVAESPLDWFRMWFEGVKQSRDRLTSVKTFEGALIQTLFADAWGVTPLEDPERYTAFSTYTYFDTTARKREVFRNLAIRAYTYLPVNYWNTPNGNGVYDCNYPDMAGLINEQHLEGNDRAELITFAPARREATYEMRKQTDTWEEVDKADLVGWVLTIMGLP